MTEIDECVRYSGKTVNECVRHSSTVYGKENPTAGTAQCRTDNQRMHVPIINECVLPSDSQ
eukprot:12783-Pyramimonas_sp.AAC.1